MRGPCIGPKDVRSPSSTQGIPNNSGNLGRVAGRDCLGLTNLVWFCRMPTASQVSDLIGRIEEQLGRYGIAGRVTLEGSTLRLTGHGRSIAMEFSDLEAWSAAPSADQSRMLERTVRDLVRARANLTGPKDHSGVGSRCSGQ